MLRSEVERDYIDLPSPLWAELPEERRQRLSASSFRCPDDSARDVVDDHGDVVVSFSVGELVDPDEAQTVEPGGVKSLADDPLHDLANGDPGDPHDLGHRSLVGHAGQVRRGLLKRRAEPACGRTPGNLFVDHSASSALHAARRIPQPDPRRANVEVPPLPSFALVVAWRAFFAPAASRLLTAWPHVEHDPFAADLSRLHHDARDSQKSLQYFGDARGALPARLPAWSLTEEHGSRAFLYTLPTLAPLSSEPL